MKLAIVHDFLMTYGGAERVLEHIHEIWPKAPVYTLRYSPEGMHRRLDDWEIRSSYIDRLPLLGRRHTAVMPLYAQAIEQFDFSEYDIVISSSSVFAHGIITQPKTTHICYYHTPARFLWDYHFEYLKEKGWQTGVKGRMTRRFLHRLRQWDYLAAKRPDIRLVNSKTVQTRLKKFYREESKIIYPGIDTTDYRLPTTDSSRNYFITLSRLTLPKKIDLAIQACNELKAPLHVIGTGEDLKRLQQMAGPTIKFTGFLSDEAVKEEMAGCKALLWPNVDDFGLVPVETMAMGRPVIAFNQGGATETVADGQTGVLFNDQSVKGLVEGIKQFEKIEAKLDSKAIHKHALQFSKEEFQKKIKRVVDQV